MPAWGTVALHHDVSRLWPSSGMGSITHRACAEDPTPPTLFATSMGAWLGKRECGKDSPLLHNSTCYSCLLGLLAANGLGAKEYEVSFIPSFQPQLELSAPWLESHIGSTVFKENVASQLMCF